MKIKFVGATETVTGSKTLVQTEKGNFLVDCGMYQGPEEISKLNFRPFPFDPKSLDAVFLTHSHIDHSGLLPHLVASGFKGPIYTTKQSAELCRVLLKDSAEIHEEEAQKRSRTPLYSKKDVEEVLFQIKVVDWTEEQKIEDLTFSFHPAGHILGAASVALTDGNKRVLFSGDHGRDDDLIMYSPNPPQGEFDGIVIEGTYGDRLHSKSPSAEEELKSYIQQIVKNQSVLMIPAFAVARSQEIMYLIEQIFRQNPELEVPFYINSPMMEEVTALYERFAESTRLKSKEAQRAYHLGHYIEWVKESIQLNKRSGPMIILAASGMISGGRIIHHLKAFADDPQNIVLLTGFQAPETAGREIEEGAKRVYINGQKIDISAQIKKLTQLSAHADRDQLTELVHRYPKKAQVFLIHGEEEVLNSFQKHLQELRPDQQVRIPKSGEAFDI